MTQYDSIGANEYQMRHNNAVVGRNYAKCDAIIQYMISASKLTECIAAFVLKVYDIGNKVLLLQ